MCCLPKKIKEMQNILDKKLDAHANLIMRCFITKDISSTGSTSGIVARNLDGEFITSKLHPNVKTDTDCRTGSSRNVGEL